METRHDTAETDTGGQRDLDRALPGAIARAARDSTRLAESLTEPVENALRLSVQRNPMAMVDALAPIIGRALFRSAAERIRGWVLALNRALLVSVSARAWRWRAEAWRTGQPYADVVRNRTLAHRIRQVFLIHRHTGLLLQSAARGDEADLDGDMVSAMLTAIQDFVQDSFAATRKGRLQSIRVGSAAVWVEQGRHAILAGVIDGDPTPEMEPVFRGALEGIHRDFAGLLSSFEGGTAAFEPARLYLESCVNARFRASGERLLPLTWALLCAVPAALGLWGVLYLRDSIAWQAYVHEIAAQPGIVVVESGRHNGKFYIKGLHDPLALDPVSMLKAMGIDRRDVEADWQPFQALLPELALLRARQVLRPPDTVALEITGSLLKVRGAASPEWIEEARRLAHTLPGVTSLEMAGLTAAEARVKRLWDQYVESLADEPGVIVLSTGYRDGRATIRGLRDPAAVDPERRLADMGIDPDGVAAVWEPYDAGGALFVLARARRVLAAPQSVSLALEGSTLIASGEAPHRWVREAAVLARTVKGVTGLRTTDLRDTEMAAIGAAADELVRLVIVFFDGGSDPVPGQARKIERMTALLRQIDDLAYAVGEPYMLDVLGYVTDGPDEDGNIELSLAIARRIIELLQHQNVQTYRCRAGAAGSSEVPFDKADLPRGSAPKRAVTVRLRLPECDSP